MLKIIFYFININFKVRNILLNIKRLFNFYFNKNMIKLFILMFNIYKL